MADVKQLWPKETAAVLRRLLAREFPACKFSVTTARGSMVSSVDVRWTDGPTVNRVQMLVARFECGSFNGMTDSFDYAKGEARSITIDGVRYEKCCEYVHTSRTVSARLANRCIAEIAAFWGGVAVPLPVAVDNGYGGYSLERGRERVRPDLDHMHDWYGQIHRAASNRCVVTRGLCNAPLDLRTLGRESPPPSLSLVR